MAQILGIVQTSSGSSALLRSLCEQYLPGIEVRQFVGEGSSTPPFPNPVPPRQTTGRFFTSTKRLRMSAATRS